MKICLKLRDALRVSKLLTGSFRLHRWMDSCSIDLERRREGVDFLEFYCFNWWSVAKSVLRATNSTFLLVRTTTLLEGVCVEDDGLFPLAAVWSLVQVLDICLLKPTTLVCLGEVTCSLWLKYINHLLILQGMNGK